VNASTRLSFLLVSLCFALSACDQLRIRNTSTHVEPPENASAFIVGSGEEKSSGGFQKVFPVQVDWDAIRDSPLTFNPFDVKRGLRVGVRVSPGERNVWSELRLRRGFGQPELYAGATLTFKAELGKTYVVRSEDLGDKAKLWVANAQTDEVVSDVLTPTLGKPAPGFPRTPIIIFIPR
jgi:hypothetical protein